MWTRIAAVLIGLLIVAWASASGAPWLLVDTHSHTVVVKQGGHVLARFNNMAIGRGGAGSERRLGDERTPLGTFRVAWVNTRSPFHLFYGLDYPTPEYAKWGLKKGLIDVDTYERIVSASRAGALPPQDTALGGHLGIHGLGHADLALHRRADWTRGCVALTNEQIDRLSTWIGIGTKVVVK